MTITLSIDGYPLDKGHGGEMKPGQIIAVLASLAREVTTPSRKRDGFSTNAK
jgi:hypothetical protein